MIHKLNLRGETTISYPGEVVAHVDGGVQVEARWERPPLDLGYTRFERGDRFVEWYFTDRWYNIFEIHDGDGPIIKGWYCNIAAPAHIAPDRITCQDLYLDLWVSANGDTRVLDEDEFVAASDLDAPTRVAAQHALGELLQGVRTRQYPFDAIGNEVSPDHRPDAAGGM